MHVVFTLPRELASLALRNKRLVYNALFHTSAETLLEIASDPRHLGAEIGFFSVLHSWNQRLQFHPHVHCVVAAGGLSPDYDRWISSRQSFFLPVKVLSRVFRGKFVNTLKVAFREDKIKFYGRLTPLAEPRAFASWLRLLFGTTGSSTPNGLSAAQNMCCAISAHTLTASPSPTAGWLLSPRAT